MKVYWTDLVDRAGKSAAQAGLLCLAADQVNVLELDVTTLVGFMAGGALLSALTTISVHGLRGRRTDHHEPERGLWLEREPIDPTDLGE